MITVAHLCFSKASYAPDEPLRLIVQFDVHGALHAPLVWRIFYARDTESAHDQLLDETELVALDCLGRYQVDLATSSALPHCDTGVLLVRAYYGEQQFYQVGYYVHSERAGRAHNIGIDTPYVVRNTCVWSE